MNKREWSAHSLLVWTPLLKPQLRTCCKSIFCLFVYNVNVSMNKSRRPIFSHFDRLYLLYKKILYGEEARCILFVFRSVFSARPMEEILSEHDKPILSASVANQNAVFALSFPFKFQSLTRQELVTLTRDQALLLFFFPLFFWRGGGREKVWKMSPERRDSKTGEGTTSGQYYAFLQDKITVKNNRSKALLSIRRGLFYDGSHFRRDIYRKMIVC